jgi:hypothetical protein
MGTTLKKISLVCEWSTSPDLIYEPHTVLPYESSSNVYLRYYTGNLAIRTATGRREYVLAEAVSTIEANHTYYVEAFMKSESLGSQVDFGTIDLFSQKPHVCSDNSYISEYGGNGNSQKVIDVKLADGYSTDSLGWIRFNAFFIAEHDFNWIAIGGGKAVYWDDIRIVEVGDDLCKDDWYFDNTVFNQPFEIFQAGDSIVAGTGADPEASQLAGPVTVLSTSHTIFRAGNSIDLLPGFSVDSLGGAIFETFIEPCQNLCPPISYPNITEGCISTPTEIGVESYENTFAQMQWYPSTYLDDPSSVNPTFTPPGGNGSITYTVAYGQFCEYANYSAQGIYNVTINYSDGLNTQPTISYSNLTTDNYSLSGEITVNYVVNDIEVTYDLSNGIPLTFILTRGVHFNSNTFTFGEELLLTSCCANTNIQLTALNPCGEDASISILWEKDDTPSFVLPLPNVLTEHDGNDIYSFDLTGGCRYEIQVFNRWGNVVYQETGNVPPKGTVLTNWNGQHNNGNDLSEGTYFMIITLFNDCGESAQEPITVQIFNGKQSEDLDDLSTEYFERNLATNSTTFIHTNNHTQLVIESISTKDKEVIVTDNLGKVIYSGTFIGDFNKELPAGIYYVIITENEAILLRERIIIVN